MPNIFSHVLLIYMPNSFKF